MLINCIGGGVNQRHYDIPNVPAENGAPHETNMLEALSQLRELRTEPPTLRENGVTDIKLIRILVRASEGRWGVVMKR